MNKYEAVRTGHFERIELTGSATGASGKRWLLGTITYRPRPYELPLTEDIQLDVTAGDVTGRNRAKASDAR